jgi:hypothetical protein
MRTTLTIDTDIYETVMHISVVSGERPGKVVSRLIRQALQAEPPRPDKTARFPTFPLDAGAPPIEAAHVQRIIDEEGLF